MSKEEVIKVLCRSFCQGWDMARAAPEQERRPDSEIEEVMTKIWEEHQAGLNN